MIPFLLHIFISITILLVAPTPISINCNRNILYLDKWYTEMYEVNKVINHEHRTRPPNIIVIAIWKIRTEFVASARGAVNTGDSTFILKT